MPKLSEKIKKAWDKIPTTAQNTIISTIVCTVLTATGAPVEVCEVAKKIISIQAAVSYE